MLKFKKIKQNTTNPEQKKKNKSRMVLEGSFFSSALFAFSLTHMNISRSISMQGFIFLQNDFMLFYVGIS